jgi:hypothetical protein
MGGELPGDLLGCLVEAGHVMDDYHSAVWAGPKRSREVTLDHVTAVPSE